MKIIFLDIDGVMIPTSYFFVDRMCAIKRKIPETQIALLKYLCEKTGALIVFNTTHNIEVEGTPTIEQAMINAGFPYQYIHTDSRTSFPNISRPEAINKWLDNHPETEIFIAFDDSKFDLNERLISVDCDAGLTTAAIQNAFIKFGLKPPIIF